MSSPEVSSTVRVAVGGFRSTVRARLPWLALTVLTVLLLAAVFAPWLAPYDPSSSDIAAARLNPGSPGHLLGTDLLGRDVLSRLIWGARTSVVVGIIALTFSALIGTAIGTIAGYFGGRVDWVLMRLVDIGLSFPTVLFALVIAIFLGVGVLTLIVAVVVTLWAQFARMVRGEVLAVRSRDFVTLARIAGVSTPMILLRHVVPNTLNTMVVTASLLMAQVILLEAALSFLGLGLPPGAPAWGVMVAEGRDVLGSVWWLSLPPGLAITLVVLSLNLLGDWLRQATDPRSALPR